MNLPEDDDDYTDQAADLRSLIIALTVTLTITTFVTAIMWWGFSHG